ncbi:hypothetical protein OG911_11735 [Streptomyces sp. NBC_00208]|uniref:hypothetical protein n=1 Tax=Streptomyces sp. NBC_00208 TaxID=2975681 RepID=UPI002E2AB127|nr:hypothetical protein [Streptomyces sp. NBC_00208]
MSPVTTLADAIMSAIGPRLHYTRSPLIGWYLSGPDERILIDPLIGRSCRYYFGAGVMPDFDTRDFREAVVSELKSRPGVEVKRLRAFPLRLTGRCAAPTTATPLCCLASCCPAMAIGSAPPLTLKRRSAPQTPPAGTPTSTY